MGWATVTGVHVGKLPATGMVGGLRTGGACARIHVMTASTPESYVRSLRNPAKRAYAQILLSYFNGDGEFPERPPTLSYMSAQAVHLTLLSMGVRRS